MISINNEYCCNLFMLALTAWRENRDHGKEGLQSVINVVVNRAEKEKHNEYYECVKQHQFSALTNIDDPELTLFPGLTDAQFEIAMQLSETALAGELEDITDGALFYVAKENQSPPEEFGDVVFCANIAGQTFFKPSSTLVV